MSSPSSSKNADDSIEPDHAMSSSTTSPPTTTTSRTTTTTTTTTTTKTSATAQGAASKVVEQPQLPRRGPMAKQISQPEVSLNPPASSSRRLPRESRRINKETKGEILKINQYRLLETIGQGSYGLVKLVFNEEDDKHYAMKILSKKRLLQKAGIFARLPRTRQTSSSSPLEKVYQEIAILKKLDHPNVVRLVEVIDASEEDFLYLVFELVEGGEILQVPTDEPLSENKARDYFRYILLGLEYLHSQRIVHRDLKPSNLLVTANGQVKIADLGACDQFLPDQNDSNISSGGATPGFTAPEALESRQAPIIGGKAADIWALGVTLYAMVIGRLPWNSSLPSLYEQIKSEPLTFPESPRISTQLQKLLLRMLEKNPKSRATLDEIKRDSWVTREGQDEMPDQKSLLSQTVQVTSAEVASCVVHQGPGIAALCLVKAMLAKHSFQNPFVRASSSDSRRENTRRSLSAPDALGLTQASKTSSGSLPALCESEGDNQSQTKKSSTEEDQSQTKKSSSTTPATEEVSSDKAREKSKEDINKGKNNQ